MKYNYLSDNTPLGGRIKELPQDFIVEEVGADYKTSVKYLPDKKVEEIDWQEVFKNKKEDQEYLVLDLEKHNVSTPKAISEMARFLRLSKSRISYAGLKDKRSISSQRVSLYNPDIERLSKFYFKDIKVYNPFWSSKKIDIGNLKENKFLITIRQIESFTEKEIKDIIKDVFKTINEKGLINYFGEQRFGGVREVTAKVGRELLLKNYKDAVMLYLTFPSEYENKEVIDAREDILKNKDFKKHASSFPLKTGFERAMLNHLANNPEDFLGCFKILSKSMQYIFIHAYQSYLFNEIINLRFKKGYGVEKIPGDKVIDGRVHLPLFGFNSSFQEEKAGEIEKEIFKREGITFKDFYNKEYTVLSTKGDYRPLLTYPRELTLLSIEEDDLNQGQKKATISFTLDKGQYATVLLREIIKKENIG
jgi:tRNA pseudouridine13 synthase